jgi:carboxyl-terminal processing protease
MLNVASLNERVAYIEIRNFTTGVTDRLARELTQLKKKGISALIIDLRFNSGGVFGEALRVTELFLGEKKILLRTVKRQTNLGNYVSGNREPFHFDLALLISHQTASSAEILASAVQDHQIGVILGERSFGKGTLENTYHLENDYRVKFITAALYSPKGKSWQGKGIIPDFPVEMEKQKLAEIKNLPPEKKLQLDMGVKKAFRILSR